MSLLAGIDFSTYADESIDAAHALDRRRQEHETRHRRYRLQLRPATRQDMIAVIGAVGATELVHHEDVRHVPVRPVAGGVAFAPDRMTVDMLCDVYDLVKGIKRAPENVYDRVIEVLDGTPGMRLQDVMEAAETARTSTQRALEQLEEEGKVRVRLEKTRGSGSQRKRYYPVEDPQAAAVSMTMLERAQVL